MEIRWMTSADLAAVAAIEKSHDDGLLPKEIKEIIGQRHTVGMVAENEGGVIAGFVIYEVMNRRIQIVHLTVHPDFRRQRVGSQLIHALAEKGVKLGMELRESNLAAQLFLRSLGFTAIEVIRNYFDDTNEDAFVFTHSVDEPSLT